MHVFSDYLQPFITWIYANPNWALLITFLISFSESLAIIGSIIPGSVTMTAIGILAGSGVMRIDLTLLAATLGAIAGDSASYALGYTFRHQLPKVWPFNRHPHWLEYGKDYFAKHGGKSVLLGRFVGPLRSIIPVIAGMMHMNRWHFLLVNVISAIGWSIVYVMPGVLIGAASTELSAERASRLFLFILGLLVVIWLAGLGIKWLLIRLNLFLRANLHRFWLWSKVHPRIASFFKSLTPGHETNHYPTAALLILLPLFFIISLILTGLVTQPLWVSVVNDPVHLFLQSLRTSLFDDFFVVLSLFIHPLPLLTLVLAIAIYSIYYRNWRMLRFWLSLILTTSVISAILALCIDIPKPNGLPGYPEHVFYPALDLTLATAMFGFLLFYVSTRYRTVLTLSLRISLFAILALAGIGIIYLGSNWLTSVLGAYSIGITLCLIHWLFFRRTKPNTSRGQLPIVFSCLLFFITTVIAYHLYFNALVQAHRPYVKQHILNEKIWWDQQQLLLPLYTKNRIGQPVGLLNIQYAGPIEPLQLALTAQGWEKQTNSFFYNLLLRFGGHESNAELPLKTQLYQSKKPEVVMTYQNTAHEHALILRLWRSNYVLFEHQQPIWLGSVLMQSKNKERFQYPESSANPFQAMLPAIMGFEMRVIKLEKSVLKSLSQPYPPNLLLIDNFQKESRKQN